uniref:Uncharacterized protein n=1 Tax=Lepeophtheirus salmonis TaxID=72036 RepID=A0A0K2UUA4_LEPSM
MFIGYKYKLLSSYNNISTLYKLLNMIP